MAAEHEGSSPGHIQRWSGGQKGDTERVPHCEFMNVDNKRKKPMKIHIQASLDARPAQQAVSTSHGPESIEHMMQLRLM